MNFKELKKEIEKSYESYFINSKCAVQLSTSLYPSISITCFLANDKSENSGNYWDNDMFSIAFSIDTITGELPKDTTEESELSNNLRLKVWRKSYLIKPENRNMCYNRTKLSFRQAKGDTTKIVKSLDKFFARLKESILKDLESNLIHDNYIDIVKRKVN